MEKVHHQPGMPLRLVATPLLAGAGLFVDYAGLGAALASAFYIGAVHLAIGLPGRRSALGTALAVCALLVMGAGFAAPAPPLSAMFDRLGCILLIVVFTKVSLDRKRAFETLARKQEEAQETTAEDSARLAEVLERLRHEAQRRREAESALRKNQEHFNLAVIGSRDGIWDWFDVERDEEWWSPRFYQLLGYEPGEIDSTLVTFGGILHPDDKERTFQAVEEHLAGNAEFDIEYRLRTKSGAYRWFHARGRAFRPDPRQPTRMSGTITDIHDRKLAEDNVRLANQRFERAVRGTSDGLWEWNVETDEAWYAPRFEELLGYEPDAMSDTFSAFTSHLHPDDHDTVMKAIEAHLENEEPLDCEHRLLTEADEYRWFRLRGAAERDESGRAVRMAGSLQEVTASELQFLELEYAKQTTEEQALELQLQSLELEQARDAALESARLKSEFLATMSHEIRTPMNGVIGMTGLLLDTDLDPEQRECADAIRFSADSLLGIINDILDFSKIEAGRLAFETLDFDLVETVEGAVDLLADQAFSKGVELAVLFSPGVPRQLRGDPGRLRQVLVNLIGNAVKFTHEGEVIVRVDPASEDDDGATVHFAVHDTGIGMSEQQQRLLFEPFVQAEGGTTRKYGGTGLGLAISKQLTRMMKGDIGIRSEPGRGSTFWFTAVFGKSTKSASPFCGLPIPPQQVLVVAHHRTVAEVVEQGVSGSEVTVQGVSRIDEAVAILQEEDLKTSRWTILLDISFDPSGMTPLMSLLREPDFAKAHRLVVLRSLTRIFHQGVGNGLFLVA